MSSCRECCMLADNHCKAHIYLRDLLGKQRVKDMPPPPIGACMLPIVREYFQFVKAGMRVLEIGCGSWSEIRDYCLQAGAQYDGVDTEPEYYGEKTVATRIENLSALSFSDDSFDVVIGTQCMEHWAENGCTLRFGLYQCFRVCRPGGRVLMNVPIHFHGTRPFKLGDIDRLRHLFSKFSSQIQFHNWGNPSDPIPPYFPYPGYWPLRNKPAYQLDIRAVKDKSTPKFTNMGATEGRLSEILNYPPSANAYRLLRRLGFWRD